MKKLIIDTTDRNITTVKLTYGKKTDELKEKSLPKSQTVLLLIDKILKRNKLSPFEIEEIEVNAGPGSFTGTRVGVAIANALGFSLGVKVNGKTSAHPRYN